jgi:hypothetical protein
MVIQGAAVLLQTIPWTAEDIVLFSEIFLCERNLNSNEALITARQVFDHIQCEIVILGRYMKRVVRTSKA